MEALLQKQDVWHTGKPVSEGLSEGNGGAGKRVGMLGQPTLQAGIEPVHQAMCFLALLWRFLRTIQ